VPIEPTYPFVPKSNRKLHPGQFWSIPLSGGRFAAGRVMLAPAFGATDRVGVVVGLMDWVGDAPPTEQDIADRPVVIQAVSRYDTITKTGGEVLGLRPLSVDGLEPINPGATNVGSSHRVWGALTILKYAEQLA
jgi:hypothetical protein